MEYVSVWAVAILYGLKTFPEICFYIYECFACMHDCAHVNAGPVEARRRVGLHGTGYRCL